MGAPKISAIGRVSFPKLANPETYEDGDPKYTITLLFDKDDPALADMKKAASEAVGEKYKSGATPDGFRSPFKDGDKKNADGKRPEYAGKVVCQFKSTRKPDIIGPTKAPIDANDRDGVYPGCFARVVYKAYCYNKKGNAGVNLSLEGVQKTGDGDRLDSVVDVFNAFDAVESESAANLF